VALEPWRAALSVCVAAAGGAGAAALALERASGAPVLSAQSLHAAPRAAEAAAAFRAALCAHAVRAGGKVERRLATHAAAARGARRRSLRRDQSPSPATVRIFDNNFFPCLVFHVISRIFLLLYNMCAIT